MTLPQDPAPQRVSASGLFAMAQRAEAEGQTQSAEAFFKALQAQGALTVAAAGRAKELEDLGDFAGAAAALRTGLRLRPDDQELLGRLGRHQLREGDFAEGWALLETREITISQQIRGRPRLSFPEWSGEAVNSLLVFGEQGLGDQIQFARYIAALKAREIEVVFACAPPLITLFESLGVPLIPTVAGAALPPCDAWVMLQSLPFRLGTTLETIPPPVAIACPPGGSGVGLVTRGNPGHPNDLNRSLPEALAAKLRALPGVVSLHPEDTGARDMAATAAIIGGLAEVVSVDTSVAHLAGSMGKRCRLLLPFVPDWRWLRERTDSPWYPSLRLYRQPSLGDWDGVLAAVIKDVIEAG